MNQHRFALALCALVSSLLLADVANAYPTTSSGTLRKGYQPIDVNLNKLVEDTDDVRCVDCGDVLETKVVPTEVKGKDELSVTLVFEGTWTPFIDEDGVSSYLPVDGVPPVDGGFAGFWVYELDTQVYEDLVVSRVGDLITVSGGEVGDAFGTFTYVGGFEPDAGLPYGDTPLPGDIFQLFTTGAKDELVVTLLNGGSDFAVVFNGALAHVGPFVCEDEGDGGGGGSGNGCKNYLSTQDLNDELCEIDDLTLDKDRSFQDCTLADTSACGLVTDLKATSVPEPGILGLFGLGLASLGIRFRRRKALLV